MDSLTPLIEVAVAILTVESRHYVLQHRDERPGISYPGFWGLFGGGLEPGERADDAIRREIREELCLDLACWRRLWRIKHFSPFRRSLVGLSVYQQDVTTVWPRHNVREGQCASVFTIDRLPQDTVPLACALIERYDDTIARRAGP